MDFHSEPVPAPRETVLNPGLVGNLKLRIIGRVLNFPGPPSHLATRCFTLRLKVKLTSMVENLTAGDEKISELHGQGILNGFTRGHLALESSDS